MAPVYVPDPAWPISAADLLEELGAELSARYTNAEQTLIEETAKRAYKIMLLEQSAADTVDAIAHQRIMMQLATARAQALRELRAIAQVEVARIRADGLAKHVMDIAAAEGEAAAAAQLGLARRLPSGMVAGSAAQSVGALTIDLHSKLEFLNARITRYPDDAFKQIISEHSPRVLLGVETPLIVQRKAVQTFLSQGIEGFVDKADRHWRIGTYTEMATRTSVQRAFQDAGIWRMQQSGVNLVTISVGLDACERCTAQSGKIFSTDGTTGDIILPHATEDRGVAVHIDGTVSDARAAGWGHPNDRCQLHAYLPGLPVAAPVQYDKAAEDERAKQRSIEREIRAAKRDAATAGDDMSRAKANREVKDLQGEMRDFINATGRNRNSAREQLHFADGGIPIKRP